MSAKTILVTGAAGFIGSYLCEDFLEDGLTVIGVDNLSNGSLENLEVCLSNNRFTFVEANVIEIANVLKNHENISEVWHLAANTDIIKSAENPLRDLNDGLIATMALLEYMREGKISRLIFASSGSVYGNLENIEKVSEETGPLLPVSSYGAGKLAAEAFISAYCSVYDLEAFIFRFGNVLGNRINHGVIWDFTGRILENPSKLKILGDGTQEKNYFLVGDCIKGMKFVTARQTRIPGKAYVFNLGNSTTTNVVEIARLVIEESGFKGASIEIEGSELAWKGDQPIIKLNCEKVKELGWTCETSSDEAVRITTRALLKVRANET